MAPYQKLEVSDASQGITDDIIGRPPSYYDTLHNFVIGIDKNPSVRPGSIVEGANDTLGKSTSGSKMFLVKNLSVDSSPYRLINSTGAKFLYNNGSTFTELTGPGSASLFDSAHSSATDNRICNTTWNNHKILSSTSFTQYPQVVYDSSGLKLRTLGLPKPTNITTSHITYSSGTTAYYIYFFIWEYTYTTGGRTFEIQSAPLRIQIGTTGSPPSKVVPPSTTALANTSSPVTHYDTASANLVLKCYRTLANGVTAYLVDTILNSNINGVDAAASRFDDSIADSALDDGEALYFNGGLPQNDPPPICKFYHVTERGTAYAGYYQDTDGSTIRNGIRQSIPGRIWAMPGDFYDTLDGDVTGISSYRGVPLFFTRDATYKAESEFLLDGTGVLRARKISETVGCINHHSIVQTEYGVFFASETGFYWTDSYQVRTISDEIKTETYKNAYPNETAELNIRAAYDVQRQLVVWSYRETSTSHALFAFHRRFGVKEDGVFTTWGGRATTPVLEDKLIYPSTMPTTVLENFRVDDLLYADDLLYRADARGYAFYFDNDTKVDPRVVTTDNLSGWKSTHIYYNLTTSALDFGSAMVRKWQPYVTFVLRNTGNISVQPSLERDLDTVFRPLKQIKHTGLFSWGTAGVLWGDPVIWQSVQSLFIETRRARAQGLRCTYRTLRLDNAFAILKSSTLFGTVTVSGTTSKSVLLDSAGSYDWPVDSLDYYVTFEADNYTRHYLVTARSDDTLTISDASQLAPTGSGLNWRLVGYEKGAVVDIQNITFPFLPISDSITAYHAGDDGSDQ